MSSKIFKYKIDADQNVIRVRGRVLSAGVQDHEIMVWAVHDPDNAERNIVVTVVGTGNPIPSGNIGKFVNTVFVGTFVFHIFTTEYV